MIKKTIFLFLSFLAITPLPTLAQTPAPLAPLEEEISLRPYLKSAETLVITENLNSDTYLAGGTVQFDAEIIADLHLAGGTVTINGPIHGRLIIAGGTVIINSTIDAGVIVLGGSVHFTKESILKSYLLTAGGTINLEGPVEGEVKAGGGSITLNNTITGPVTLAGDNQTVGPETILYSHLTVFGPENSLKIDDQAILSQGFEFKQSPKPSWDKNLAKDFQNKVELSAHISSSVFTLLSSLLVGWLLLKIFDQKLIDKLLKNQEKNWLRLTLTGLLWLIITLPLTLFLLLTVLGIPLIGLWWLLTLLAAFLSRFWVALLLGHTLFLPKEKIWEIKSLALGLLAIEALGLIPFLGSLTKLITLALGLGLQYRYLKTLKTS